MMLPKKVTVSGIDYDVVEKDFIEINGNRNYQGSCSYVEAEIKILSNLADARKEQVFIHELLHAVFNEAGYDEHDEDMVNRLGIVLYQVLKDNRLYFGSKTVWYEQGGETPVKVDQEIIAKTMIKELKTSARNGGEIR